MIFMLNNRFESQVELINRALQPEDNFYRQRLQMPFSRTLSQRLKRCRPGFNFPTHWERDQRLNSLLHELPQTPVRGAAWLVELTPIFGARPPHALLQEMGVNQLSVQPNVGQGAFRPRAQEIKINQALPFLNQQLH